MAAVLGYPRAARAVGQAMKHAPSHLPWHRVVNAQGGISRRANVGGILTQRGLLEQEGVVARRGPIPLPETPRAGQPGGGPPAPPAPQQGMRRAACPTAPQIVGNTCTAL